MRGDADKDKATPRPWRWYPMPSGKIRLTHGRPNQYPHHAEVLSPVGEPGADAVLIVAAVNSFDAHRQLVTAAQKAADTFADFERTMGMLGRKPVAEAAHIAGEALRAALAAVDAVEKP